MAKEVQSPNRNPPGSAKQRRHGRRMLAWLRQEIGVSHSSMPWYEGSFFWGSLGIGGSAWIAAMTVAGTLWLLPIAWIFLCLAGWSAIKRIRSRKVMFSVLLVSSVFIAAVIALTAVLRWPVPTSHNAATAVPEKPPVRIDIDYMRTDWGHAYNPRTLLMAYYRLNGTPSLSPIDLWAEIRVINTQASPVTIEAWSIETAPTPNGPWLRLMPIPGSPHLIFYVVGSLKNKPSNAVAVDDLTDALSAPIVKEAKGWALCECPSTPPCLGWYERIRLRDTQGKDYSQVISLSDYNASLGLTKTAEARMRTSKAEPRDLTRVQLVRPFPQDAYRVSPKKEGQVAILERAH